MDRVVVAAVLAAGTSHADSCSATGSLPVGFYVAHVPGSVAHQNDPTMLVVADGDQTFVSGQLSLFVSFEREHPAWSHSPCLLHAQVESCVFFLAE
jgi:hypothetical protein